jgi:hypothetical protein
MLEKQAFKMHNLLKINIVKTTIIDLKIAFLGKKLAKGVPYAPKQSFSYPNEEHPFLEKMKAYLTKTQDFGKFRIPAFFCIFAATFFIKCRKEKR